MSLIFSDFRLHVLLINDEEYVARLRNLPSFAMTPRSPPGRTARTPKLLRLSKDCSSAARRASICRHCPETHREVEVEVEAGKHRDDSLQMMGQDQDASGPNVWSKDSVLTKTPSPGTLKPPIEPPRRRSSLGFSKTIVASARHTREDVHISREDQFTSDILQRPVSNIGKKRATATPLRHSQASPSHVDRVQRLFQSATATLRLDMQYAASPNGSIASRLPSVPQSRYEPELDSHSPPSDAEQPQHWRYSIVPSTLPTASLDVREPLPEELPALPGFPDRPYGPLTPVAEPASSGYASPAFAETKDLNQKPSPLGSSSIEDSSPLDHGASEIQQGMEDLGIRDDSKDCVSIQEVISDVEQEDDNTSQKIILSRSAQAAGDHARRKRGFETSNTGSKLIKESIGLLMSARDSSSDDQSGVSGCPHMGLPGFVTNTPCPNPLAHFGAQTPTTRTACSSHSNSPLLSSRAFHGSYYTGLAVPRVNARGSPMPFYRPQIVTSTATRRQMIGQHHLNDEAVAFAKYHKYQPNCPPRRLSPELRIDHFPPASYVSDKSPGLPQLSPRNAYAFSTEAAKAGGVSVSPDSRIRDSYRTDTLTPFLLPPKRFRKNGIGAEVRSRNQWRANADHAVQTKPSTRTVEEFRNRTPLYTEDRIFRSSPPRPSTGYVHQGIKRGRNRYVHTPEFDIVRDSSTEEGQLSATDQMCDGIDVATKIRLSTPDDNHRATPPTSRDEFQELSPNVRLWRKGLRGGPQHRKKRRPSYWDNDLKEVRMSYAARGEIESSPIMSNRSMMAELESASCQEHNPESVGPDADPSLEADEAIFDRQQEQRCPSPEAMLVDDVEALHAGEGEIADMRTTCSSREKNTQDAAQDE